MTDKSRIYMYEEYEAWLTTSQSSRNLGYCTKSSAPTTWASLPSLPDLLDPPCCTKTISSSSGNVIPPHDIHEARFTDDEDKSKAVPITADESTSRPIQPSEQQATEVVSSLLFNVKRSPSNNDVLENKYQFCWPKLSNGKFVPCIYVSMVDGGDGGSGAARLATDVFCKVLSDVAQNVDAVKYVGTEGGDEAIIGAGGSGGRSGAMIKCMPIQCPSQDETLQLLVEVEVGIGGKAGANVDVTASALHRLISDGYTDTSTNAWWIMDPCRGEEGQIGQPSKVRVSQFSGHPITLHTGMDSSPRIHEARVTQSGSINMDWYSGATKRQSVVGKRDGRFASLYDNAKIGIPWALPVPIDAIQNLLDAQLISQGGFDDPTQESDAHVVAVTIRSILLSQPGVKNILVPSHSPFALAMRKLNLERSSSPLQKSSESDCYAATLPKRDDVVNASGGKSVSTSSCQSKSTNEKNDNGEGQQSSINFAILRELSILPAHMQVSAQVTTFDESLKTSNISIQLTGIGGGHGGCGFQSKHAYMASAPTSVPIGGTTNLLVGMTKKSDSLLNQTFVAPKSNTSTGYPWPVTCTAVKSSWQMPFAGVSGSTSKELQQQQDVILAYGGAGAWTAHVMANDEHGRYGEGGHGGAVAVDKRCLFPEMSLEPSAGKDGQVCVYWVAS